MAFTTNHMPAAMTITAIGYAFATRSSKGVTDAALPRIIEIRPSRACNAMMMR